MILPTIILIRHGETLWNVEGRYQGQLNSDLTPKGKVQAKENAFKVEKELDFTLPFKFYSSPLGRAKESAIIISEVLGLKREEIIFDDRIKELNYGIFEGKTKEECAKNHSKELAEREADKWSYLIEGGESYEEVSKRLHDWLDTIKEEKFIIMVAHEMVNRALRGVYCNYSKQKILNLRQANDVVIKLQNRAETILN